MLQLIIDGGLVFTGPLSVIGLLIIGLTLKKGYDLFGPATMTAGQLEQGLPLIGMLSVFALVFGQMGLMVALIGAFDAIEDVGNVSQAMLAGGLKVALLTPTYGMLIFLVGGLCWGVLYTRYRRLLLSV